MFSAVGSPSVCRFVDPKIEVKAQYLECETPQDFSVDQHVGCEEPRSDGIHRPVLQGGGIFELVDIDP